jgi:hypothetical protein
MYQSSTLPSHPHSLGISSFVILFGCICGLEQLHISHLPQDILRFIITYLIRAGPYYSIVTTDHPIGPIFAITDRR